MKIEKVEDMVGKVFVMVYRDYIDGDEIRFYINDASYVRFFHDSEGCEVSVSIEDICGDLDDLIDTPILKAEEVHNYTAFGTWTFYKFSTIKGSVTIRWYGSSNGFYSEKAEFEFVEFDTSEYEKMIVWDYRPYGRPYGPKIVECYDGDKVLELWNYLIKQNLSNLTQISFNNCGLTSIEFFRSIEHLEANNLKIIYLNENNISDLSPISFLTNVEKLYLGYNKITDVSPLRNFKKLKELDLSGNKKLENTNVLEKLGIEKLTLDHTPFKVDKLVSDLGEMSESLYIKNFGPLKEISMDEIKPLMILVGESGSGKSTLMKLINMFRNMFIEHDVDYHQMKLTEYLEDNCLDFTPESDSEIIYSVSLDEISYMITFKNNNVTVDTNIRKISLDKELGERFKVCLIPDVRGSITYIDNTGNLPNCRQLKNFNIVYNKIFYYYKNHDRNTSSSRNMAPILALSDHFKENYALIGIEEPEIGLSPELQCWLINELISKYYVNKTERTKLMLSTHSPYIINYLNLLIKANDCDKPIDGAKIEFEKLAVYEIEDGKILDLTVKNQRIINTNSLSDTINDIYNEYEEMTKC
jgi:predicted ATPase